MRSKESITHTEKKETPNGGYLSIRSDRELRASERIRYHERANDHKSRSNPPSTWIAAESWIYFLRFLKECSAWSNGRLRFSAEFPSAYKKCVLETFMRSHWDSIGALDALLSTPSFHGRHLVSSKMVRWPSLPPSVVRSFVRFVCGMNKNYWTVMPKTRDKQLLIGRKQLVIYLFAVKSSLAINVRSDLNRAPYWWGVAFP